ncbi:MAG: DNA polymerase III subunit alpha [Acidimicrobiales bacterium]
MPARSFTHLHTHTEFSMLDGAARIDDLVQAAVEDSQPALGITDHGNMYGVLDFYAACTSAGINPVIGTEAYMAAESRHERPVRKGKVDDTGGDTSGGEKLYYHLTLLAESTEGYRNLLKLSSAAFLEGYYYKPRVDWELLSEYSTGLIATTGCLGGVVLQALLADDRIRAESLAGRLQDIFGKDNLFVELQDHHLPEQQKTNPALVEIAKHLGAPLLATNDSHYTHREDHIAHDALLCVQTGARIDDPKRFKFEGEEHYLKTAAEMRHLFSELPDACDNTLLIAERAHVELDFGKPSLPRFPVPAEHVGRTYEERADRFLRSLSIEGAKERYGPVLPDSVSSRLDYELGVISDMGFSAYFLVVWDLIRFARSRGIRVGPGRGSAAGCCVAYCLKIVDLDPIRYDLLFERFLNPGRIQMPDIDMDFDERYRADMIRYAAERYGGDHVAQIVTFSTIKARAAVRDAARVLGFPYMVGDKIAKAMPPLMMGRDTPLAACLERDEQHEEGFAAATELRVMYETDPEARQVIDVAKGLEGLRRQDGIHAAAVVITDQPLTEYLPIQRKPDGNDLESAPIVTQYEMHGVEELGLLKMDFLGLRNLSVIERALDLITETTGVRPDIDSIPLDDEETFAMLRKGDSMGVFQLEGGQMRTLMRSLAPTTFDDVAALIALYRPGPMAANMHRNYADRKNNRQEVTYLHPDLEEILGDTYGLMIYQESVMRVAQRIAGYTLAEADNLRKACGKKIRALIQDERKKFVDGCVAQGYGDALGNQLFDIIEPFADYAFNKSHSYGYGFIAYQTAWLKAHYPVEYLASLLTSVKDNKDKTAVYLGECRNLGIEVLVPDINRSESEFASDASGERSAITFGLSAVRNVGEGLVGLIVAERDAHGPFADFYEFCRRVDPQVLNKRTIESLVKAGAFDSLGHPRQGLCLVFEDIVDRTLERRREHDAGVLSLFASVEVEIEGQTTGFADTRVPIPDAEFGKTQRLAFEKEMLGLYVSDHPLMGLEASLAKLTDCTLAELIELIELGSESQGTLGSIGGGFDAGPQGAGEGGVKVVGGVVTDLVRRYTKKGDLMATFVLEDLTASIEVFVFPKSMATFGSLLDDDGVVVVKGRIDLRDEQLKLVLMEVQRPELAIEGDADLHIALPLNSLTDGKVEDLKTLLADHPGGSPVFLHVGETVLRLPDEFTVDSRPGLLGELRVLLGPNAVRG